MHDGIAEDGASQEQLEAEGGMSQFEATGLFRKHDLIDLTARTPLPNRHLLEELAMVHINPLESDFGQDVTGPRFPVPSGLSSDKVIQSVLNEITTTFDEIVATGNSSHGPIASNTTSFSIGVFSSTDGLDTSKPFFYEYHYTTPLQAEKSGNKTNVGAQSVYRIGSLTQVFTVWLFLAEAGEAAWTEPVTRYIPELAQAVTSGTKQASTTRVPWEDVTLGDLAAHLAGIPRDFVVNPTAPEQLYFSEFFTDLLTRPAVYLPGTTPIFSNTAFQLLAYAMEAIRGTPFTEMFHNLTAHLNMSSSSLATPADTTGAVIPSDVESSGWSTDYGDESPAVGMYSSIHDLSLAGIAILNSTLLPSAVTRRWLKPVSHTSNLRNAVGRPWIIYSPTPDQSPTKPRFEVFTNYAFVGQYSSYLILVPEYNVGFTVLAADSTTAADLNAHADFLGEIMLPALEKAAITQAGKNYAGAYKSSSTNSSQVAELVIDKPDGMPGLSLSNITRGSEDLRAMLAKSVGIEPTKLNARLYPTNLMTKLSDGRTQVAFRAVFQDESALEDGGTPTCISWEGVDVLLSPNGMPLDLLVLTLNDSGAAESVTLPGWGLELFRET
ncbi:hypothetical protein H2200_002650 [Cladophialophora chaetospira]|uniref:Beta-lactamase-related domain-containing protein n=1 Tax=Cladophialophora chaetospira TaxID=386627 RepID=A0AA39CNS2_9EURO|nr:hypothetical protein H2200_002650 [Cladophialophora chaetospira]